MTKSFAKPQRYLVVDDDPLFIKILANLASSDGVIIDGFASLDNVLADLGSDTYDAAIVDYDLGEWTGIQAINCLRSQLGGLPVVLVSHTRRKAIGREVWPPSVQAFVEKARGGDAILQTARRLTLAAS